MAKKRLRVGTKVIIRKPKDVNVYPVWVDEMDYLDGKRAVVAWAGIASFFRSYLVAEVRLVGKTEVEGFSFNQDWLRVVRSGRKS
jgi:hypothetical protein